MGILILKVDVFCILSKFSLPFFFSIGNYSPEVINVQRREAESNIILPRMNNFDIKQKRHGIFVLLHATNTKEDLGR